MPRKDENVLENVRPHEDKESILEEQDIEEDHRIWEVKVRILEAI